jgi:5-methylcytosine-specific restriction enzyme subunit McrC
MANMNGNTLVIREFERFGIRRTWDVANKTISEEDAARIALFQKKHGTTFIDLEYESARATSWVGTLGMGNRAIEVIPKIDSSEGAISDARTRENLIHMIARAGFVSIEPSEIARMVSSGKPILSAFLDLYVDNLTREWRRGAIKAYVTRSENRYYLRGKLLFQEQLRTNLIQKQRFFTACDEFIEDNPIARLLKAALVYCRSQKMCDDVARKAKHLLPDFDPVGITAFSQEEIDSIQANRQTLRFSPLIHLAKLIIRALSPASAEGGKGIYALMFDMNDIFERFIASELRRALNGDTYIVTPQVGGKSLLRKNGRGAFHLRPDIGVFRGEETVCLLDTKWKRLDLSRPHANVSQSDMYQMYAYSKEFNTPVTVLIFPRFGELPEKVAEYRHNTDIMDTGVDRKILVRTVDISSPMTSLDNQRELRLKFPFRKETFIL